MTKPGRLPIFSAPREKEGKSKMEQLMTSAEVVVMVVVAVVAAMVNP